MIGNESFTLIYYRKIIVFLLAVISALLIALWPFALSSFKMLKEHLQKSFIKKHLALLFLNI